MKREVATWLAVAGLAGLWGQWALLSGGGALLPLFAGVFALACAADAGLRRRFTSLVIRILSHSTLRATVILIGATMLWQVVGLELALLMAGDVLVYVEVLAAVSLLAASVRLAPLKARLARRLQPTRRAVTLLFARGARVSRSVRRPRPGSPPPDDDDRPCRGFAAAIAAPG